MPYIKVTTNCLTINKTELASLLHNALINILKTPDYDRLITFNCIEKDFFQPLNTDGKFVIVEIAMFSGRTIESKRALYKEITDIFEKSEFDKANVRIILNEIPRENWSIRNGQAACDIEINFKTNI